MKKIIFLLSISLLFFACEKEENVTPEAPVTPAPYVANPVIPVNVCVDNNITKYRFKDASTPEWKIDFKSDSVYFNYVTTFDSYKVKYATDSVYVEYQANKFTGYKIEVVSCDTVKLNNPNSNYVMVVVR